MTSHRLEPSLTHEESYSYEAIEDLKDIGAYALSSTDVDTDCVLATFVHSLLSPLHLLSIPTNAWLITPLPGALNPRIIDNTQPRAPTFTHPCDPHTHSSNITSYSSSSPSLLTSPPTMPDASRLKPPTRHVLGLTLHFRPDIPVYHRPCSSMPVLRRPPTSTVVHPGPSHLPDSSSSFSLFLIVLTLPHRPQSSSSSTPSCSTPIMLDTHHAQHSSCYWLCPAFECQSSC